MNDAPHMRCGFVAVLGAPNAGKSTLINELVGAKVNIVTHKVQTTRIRIMGIATKDDSQIVFIGHPEFSNRAVVWTGRWSTRLGGGPAMLIVLCWLSMPSVGWTGILPVSSIA